MRTLIIVGLLRFLRPSLQIMPADICAVEQLMLWDPRRAWWGQSEPCWPSMCRSDTDPRFRAFSIRNRIMGIALPAFGILIFVYIGVFADPLTHWHRAIEMSPLTFHAYFKMGLAVSKIIRDPVKATGRYRQAIRLDPKIATYYNYLCVAYGVEGLPSQAEKEYQIAVKLGGIYLAAYGNLGYSEYLSGNYPLAEAHWKHILAIDSTFPDVEYALADLYVVWKKYPEARYHIQRLRARGVLLDSLLSSVPDQ